MRLTSYIIKHINLNRFFQVFNNCTDKQISTFIKIQYLLSMETEFENGSSITFYAKSKA